MALPSDPDRAPIRHYPYRTDISAISGLIRSYIDTPREDVLTASFDDEHWGLIDILRAADRRIGARHWASLRARLRHPAALKVLEAREQRHRRTASAPVPAPRGAGASIRASNR